MKVYLDDERTTHPSTKAARAVLEQIMKRLAVALALLCVSCTSPVVDSNKESLDSHLSNRKLLFSCARAIYNGNYHGIRWCYAHDIFEEADGWHNYFFAPTQNSALECIYYARNDSSALKAGRWRVWTGSGYEYHPFTADAQQRPAAWEPVVCGGADCKIGDPSVVEHNGVYYMLLSHNCSGRYVYGAYSYDKITWTKGPLFPDGARPGAVKVGNTLRVYYDTGTYGRYYRDLPASLLTPNGFLNPNNWSSPRTVGNIAGPAGANMDPLVYGYIWHMLRGMNYDSHPAVGYQASFDGVSWGNPVPYVEHDDLPDNTPDPGWEQYPHVPQWIDSRYIVVTNTVRRTSDGIRLLQRSYRFDWTWPTNE